jgi:aspartyl/asparaginyl-tRNA synthetase
MVAKLSWIVPGLILDASDRAYSAAALPAKAKKSGLSAAGFNRYHCMCKQGQLRHAGAHNDGGLGRYNRDA